MSSARPENLNTTDNMLRKDLDVPLSEAEEVIRSKVNELGSHDHSRQNSATISTTTTTAQNSEPVPDSDEILRRIRDLNDLLKEIQATRKAISSIDVSTIESARTAFNMVNTTLQHLHGHLDRDTVKSLTGNLPGKWHATEARLSQPNYDQVPPQERPPSQQLGNAAAAGAAHLPQRQQHGTEAELRRPPAKPPRPPRSTSEYVSLPPNASGQPPQAAQGEYVPLPPNASGQPPQAAQGDYVPLPPNAGGEQPPQPAANQEHQEDDLGSASMSLAGSSASSDSDSHEYDEFPASPREPQQREPQQEEYGTMPPANTAGAAGANNNESRPPPPLTAAQEREAGYGHVEIPPTRPDPNTENYGTMPSTTQPAGVGQEPQRRQQPPPAPGEYSSIPPHAAAGYGHVELPPSPPNTTAPSNAGGASSINNSSTLFSSSGEPSSRPPNRPPPPIPSSEQNSDLRGPPPRPPRGRPGSGN